ncbi:N/A [soil metagenome]
MSESSKRNPTLNAAARTLFDGAQRAFEQRDDAGAERLGEKLGRLVYRFDRKHRERTHANLRLAYPEASQSWIDSTAQGVFLHFGRVLGDFMRSKVRTIDGVLATTAVEGKEIIDRYPPGTAIIAATAHMGNWERFGHWCTAIGRPISVVARDADDGEIQRRVDALRASTGLEVLSRGNAARASLKALKEGKVLGLLPDQNGDECFVPFFGLPTGHTLGPAVLHKRTGAPLIPAFCVREGVGKYRVIVLEPIDPSGEGDSVAVTAEVAASLESVIRRYPEQWLWMHDRWKSSRQRGMLPELR